MDLEMDYNIVVPGKIIFVNQSGMLSSSQAVEGEKVKTVTSKYPSWIAKELLFEKEHPKDVLEELKRHFDIQIESVNLPSSELFTGKLPGDNPDVALQIFASSYHLKPVKKAAQKYSFESVP